MAAPGISHHLLLATFCPFLAVTGMPPGRVNALGLGLYKKDYFFNLLEQLNRVLTDITDLVKGGRANEALTQVEQVQAHLAGPVAPMIEKVDAASVVRMLGPEKADLYATLNGLRAEVYLALNKPERSQKEQTRTDLIRAAVERTSST